MLLLPFPFLHRSLPSNRSSRHRVGFALPFPNYLMMLHCLQLPSMRCHHSFLSFCWLLHLGRMHSWSLLSLILLLRLSSSLFAIKSIKSPPCGVCFTISKLLDDATLLFPFLHRSLPSNRSSRHRVGFALPFPNYLMMLHCFFLFFIALCHQIDQVATVWGLLYHFQTT